MEENMMEKKQRSCNLDVIRIFAFLTVVGVHFFRETGLYGQVVVWDVGVVSVFIRNFCMICVPLFMLLSGYLLIDRTPCKAYYLKIFQTIGIYVLASLACTVYHTTFKSEPSSLKNCLVGIFSFKTAPYSWYVEMYLGFFLFIPFLNRMYNGNSKKTKERLILIFLLLTALPTVMNIWNLTSLSWWLNPASSEDYTLLVPDAWAVLYPITYYFIGAYLREYPLKLRIRHGVLLLFGVTTILCIFTVYRSHNAVFNSGIWAAYQSVAITVMSVLTFHCINRLNLTGVGKRGRAVLKHLSVWTLGAYLVSYIFDDTFYTYINARRSYPPHRIIYYPIVVAAVAVCSLLLSGILNLIYGWIEKTVTKALARRNKK